MRTDYNNLEARVVRLERQNRRWKSATLLLLLMIAAVISLGAVQNNDAPVMTPARTSGAIVPAHRRQWQRSCPLDSER